MPEAIRDNPLSNFRVWLIGGGEYRPIFIILGFLIFFLVINMPTPQSLESLLREPNPQGYPAGQGETIVNHLSEEFHDPDLTVEDVAQKVKITLGLLVIAAIFWGTV